MGLACRALDALRSGAMAVVFTLSEVLVLYSLPFS